MNYFNNYFHMVKQKTSGAGSVVMSTVCSSRELGFDSQHPCGGSQPLVTGFQGI